MRKLTIQERIKRHCAKFPEPPQYKIKLSWKRQDGPHSRMFGDVSTHSWYGYITKSVGSNAYAAVYNYDAKIQLFEISYIIMEGNTPKLNEERKWKWAYRYFMDKNKRIYDEYGKEGNYKVIYSYGIYDTISCSNFLSRITCFPYASPYKAFAKFIGDENYCGSNRYYDENNYYPYLIKEWWKIKKNSQKNSKSKSKITLNNLPLVDLPDIYKDKSARYNSRWYKSTAWYDKQNKTLRVYDGTYNEREIVLFTDKKIIAGRKNEKTNEYEVKAINNTIWGASIINLDEMLNDLPRTKYVNDIRKRKIEIDHFNYGSGNNYDTSHFIIEIIRKPEIEQLANMGCLNLACRYCEDDRLKSSLESNFGVINKNSKSFCKKYGVTQKQLKYLDELCGEKTKYYSLYFLNNIRNCAQIEKLSDLDLETFKKYVDFCEQHLNNRWGYLNQAILSSENPRKYFIRIVNSNINNPNFAQLTKDAIVTIGQISMENRPTTNPLEIKDFDELKRYHDQLVEILNIEREERRRLYNLSVDERNKELERKMKKYDEKRKILEKIGDEFIIKLPEKLSEITDEGAKLHHCVGGYIQQHSSGNTTILFLRKKNSENIPFYTIEVSNGKLVQIHGLQNKWLGNNPEAIPFVYEWLLENNINFDKKILLCKAMGYGQTNDYLNEEILKGA